MMEQRAHVLHRLEHLLDAHQREVIAGHGDHHAVDVDQRVLVEQRERRGAVEDDDVIPVDRVPETLTEHTMSVGALHQVDLGGRQHLVGREDVEVRSHGDGGLLDGYALDEHVIERLLAADPERSADVALPVDVHEEDLLALLREAGREVHGGRRLPGAALVVEHRDAPRLLARGRRERPHPRAALGGAEVGPRAVPHHHLEGILELESVAAHRALAALAEHRALAARGAHVDVAPLLFAHLISEARLEVRPTHITARVTHRHLLIEPLMEASMHRRSQNARVRSK